MKNIQLFVLIIYRECLLLFRKPSELLNPLFFFILVCSIFPLAITPTPKVLQLIGPGIIWVATLLAALLSMPRLFREDYLDGNIEQYILGAHPLCLLIVGKIIAHWVLFNLPIILILPLLSSFFYLNTHTLSILALSLFIGTLILNLVGSMTNALILGLSNNNLLFALILFPLFIPTLIFGTSAVLAVQMGLSAVSQIAMLGSLLMIAITFAPLVTSFALRVGIHY